MMGTHAVRLLPLPALALWLGCRDAQPPRLPALTRVAQSVAQGRTYVVPPGSDVQFRLQARLIEAAPGDVIQLEAGRYELHRQLDAAVDNLTIRGRGPDRTVLSFRGQEAGGQGIEATGDHFVLEGLAVEDTVGNAVKILGARDVTVRDVRVEWTAAPSSANGAYGIYPVQCRNVLLERCTAIGASDAGLYVGQCRQVVVRSCRAERNVAGIEIENTVGADVHDNVAENNSGGILVFDMPGLQLKAGRGIRIFRNRVVENNHRNFADPGSIVANVPPGTGLMVMATDEVEAFDNLIENNGTGSVLIVSYLAMDRKIADPEFDAIPEAISVHDNRIRGGGTRPQGALAALLAAAFGGRLPDILWDGVLPPGAAGPTHRLANNGDARFANFHLPQLTPENLLRGAYRYETDPAALQAEIPPLPPVVLDPHAPPAAGAGGAALVYRDLPRKLSEYGLFTGPLAEQRPAEGVVPYALNVSLFSDYAEKRRFIQLPPGTQMTCGDHGAVQFPTGTVIAKTFSYPHDMRDPSLGERLLETRIELLREGGWYGVTYVWNEEQTDAEIALGGGEVSVAWVHRDGAQRTVAYQIPNANQCLNCHSQDKAYVPIGPTARNLRRPSSSSEEGVDQLARWTAAGLLVGLPQEGAVAAWPRQDDPHAGSVDERARAWLDVNCAHCHSPGGTARTSGLDLRWEQSDPAKLGVWKSPVAAGHGSGGRQYDVVPGAPDASILLYRLESDDPSIAMPNVGRRLVDDESAALVRQWIAEMPVP
jgi:parallel beta-helix repeat protein